MSFKCWKEAQMTHSFKTIQEAFDAGKKVGFAIGFRKATQIVIDNCKKMQDKVIKPEKGGAE